MVLLSVAAAATSQASRAAALPGLFVGKVQVPRAAGQVSAAVFRKADDALIKTLWHHRGVEVDTEFALEWDGSLPPHHHSHRHRHREGVEPPRLDAAAAFNPLDYEFRVQASNVSHEWLGVIGNSGPMVGPHVMRSLYGIQQIVTAGNVGILAFGYNEGGTSFKMFDLDHPHRWIDLGHPDTFEAFPSAAYDGKTAYFGNTGICAPQSVNGSASECKGNFGQPSRSFVMGLDMAASGRFCEHSFAATGQVVCSGHVGGCPAGDIQGDHFDGCNGVGTWWNSAVDINQGNASAVDPTSGQAMLLEGVTALAVDSNDRHACGPNCSLLFATHRFLNETRVLDKQDGVLLNKIPMQDPVAVTRNGYLWSIETVYPEDGRGQRVVKRYAS